MSHIGAPLKFIHTQMHAHKKKKTHAVFLTWPLIKKAAFDTS